MLSLRDAFLRDAFLCYTFPLDAYMIVAFQYFFLLPWSFFFTSFDSVCFRIDLILFTFRLLNFVIDTLS